ncbi:MAG: serine/threonine-protein kinase [Minicystis sp.]
MWGREAIDVHPRSLSSQRDRTGLTGWRIFSAGRFREPRRSQLRTQPGEVAQGLGGCRSMSEPTLRAPAGEAPSYDPFAGSSYRAIRKLGTGGAGVVYEAVHVALGKRVAIKLLHQGLLDAPAAMERMRVEAQALARLRSPHLVEVSDFGRTSDGRPFYVMELLSGANLADELRRRGHLPADEAVELVQQLLKGLAVAHRAGIVHRDVKLENVFLSVADDGRRVLKILDFGIAKVLPDAQGFEPPALRTGEGLILGTPRFIPPEQVMGRAIDARADVYGVGIVLYELLTGRDPFHDIDGTAPLLRASVSEDPPPPSRVAPEPIEPAIEDVVMRALAKRPQDRYASAEDMSRALAHAIEIMASGRAPAPRPAGASLFLACVLVLASAALSAVLALWFTQTP